MATKLYDLIVAVLIPPVLLSEFLSLSRSSKNNQLAAALIIFQASVLF